MLWKMPEFKSLYKYKLANNVPKANILVQKQSSSSDNSKKQPQYEWSFTLHRHQS